MSPEERQMCARIVASVMFVGINYKSQSVHVRMQRDMDRDHAYRFLTIQFQIFLRFQRIVWLIFGESWVDSLGYIPKDLLGSKHPVRI